MTELLDGLSGLSIYIGLKACGYIAWSYAGLRWFEREPPTIGAALVRGIGRLLLGWATGVVVAPFAIVAAGANHIPLFYFTALAVVRWFEWGAIQLTFQTAEPRTRRFLTGGARWGVLWRAAGILISYAADAPFLLTDGFPRGRIFC